MRRGEVWWADMPKPAGRRPVVLLSRNRSIEVREYVIVAEVTRTVRDIPTEVRLGREDGLPAACVVNLDVINTVPKRTLASLITVLNPAKQTEIKQALHFALDLS